MSSLLEQVDALLHCLGADAIEEKSDVYVALSLEEDRKSDIYEDHENGDRKSMDYVDEEGYCKPYLAAINDIKGKKNRLEICGKAVYRHITEVTEAAMEIAQENEHLRNVMTPKLKRQEDIIRELTAELEHLKYIQSENENLITRQTAYISKLKERNLQLNIKMRRIQSVIRKD